MPPANGVVYLVGAGPGDPGLLTRRGAELLARADVVVYDGLVGEALLDLAVSSAVRIDVSIGVSTGVSNDVGKTRARQGQPSSQAGGDQRLIEHASRGECVVWLVAGDPFAFGRSVEACRALAAAGIDCEIVPGVSTVTSVPADAGIPQTVGEVVDLQPGLAWSEQRPLLGARVAVTRSRAASASAAQAITELGGEPVILPLTRIQAITWSDPGGPDIERAITELERYDFLLFTSAQGVSHFMDRMLERGRDARVLARACIVCVGAATAKALSARGLLADITPKDGAEASGQGAAESLIAAAGPAIARARVLFPRAFSGRDEAVSALRGAGATVDVVAVYRTVTAGHESSTDALEPMLVRNLRELRAGRVHAIVFFAPSQVAALFELLGPDAAVIVRACPLVAAIGNTTKAALTRRGVDVHVVPSCPSAEELVRAVAHAWRTHKHKGSPDAPGGIDSKES